MNSLRLENVSVSFNNNKILDNINLQFEEGKTYAIVGKSGSGKTTLLNCISNLINYDGNILFNNFDLKDISEIDKKVYKSNVIGYFNQSPLMFKNIKNKDNSRIHKLREKNSFYRWDNDLLNDKYRNKRPSKCSGGEIRRAQFIQLTNKNSFIVLADEPTNSLDSINAETLMIKLKEYSYNKILIFVTHDLSLAEKYADEIIEIKDGKCKRNFTKKIKDAELNLQQVKKINKKKIRLSSKKYLLSEGSYNGLFFSNFSILLICLSIMMSLISGINNYFNNIIKDSNKESYVLLSNNNEYEIINQEDYLELSKETDSEYLCRSYDFYDEVECNINGEIFYIDPLQFSEPIEVIDSTLSEDQIILSFTDDSILYFCELLEINNIEEYLQEESLEMIFEILNNEFILSIVDIYIDNNQTEDIVLLHSNPKHNDMYFENNNCSFITYIDKSNINDDIKKWIESSQKYTFIKQENLFYIFKNKKNKLNKSELLKYCENTISLFEEDEDYFIKYYNGLLYFNNVNLFNKGYSSNQIIYFTPYQQNLQIGRRPESNTEIAISSKLKDELNISDSLGKIEFRYSNKTIILDVVGIFENDSPYIQQSASWTNTFSNLYLYNNLNYMHADSFMMIFKPSEINNVYKTLLLKYPTYNISAPVYEANIQINNISNNITICLIALTLLLSIIVMVSLIIISKLEQSKNSNEIKLLFNSGYTHDEINKIYYKVIIKRAMLAFVLSQFISIVLIKLTNLFIETELIFDNILNYNFIIALVAFILSIFISILSFLFCRYKKSPI